MASPTAPSPRDSSANILSDRFLRRIFSIVAMGDGWNGGRERRIEPATAAAAVRLASASLSIAPEPEVGPTPNGTLLLEWQLEPAFAVEAYVGGSESPIEVVISREDKVSEAEFESAEAVLRELAVLVRRS